MPPMAIRSFRAALEKGDFDRAYFFHGDDDFLKEENVRALVALTTDPATRDFNLDLLRAADLDASALALLFDALPLMAMRRVVVIRDAAMLSKDARAALTGYLKHPASDILLLMVATAGTKTDPALLELTSAVEFKRLSAQNLEKWVSHYAASLGTTITPSANELLCAGTGNDLASLAGEIDKLRSFTNGAEIDEAAITAVAGIRHGETLGDLLEAMTVRDGARAIALLEPVLALPKTTGVSVLMALTTQTLAIGWAVAARARGLPQHKLEQEFFVLLRENPSSLVGRPWGEGVKSWVRALRHWDDASVDRALELLVSADAILKDTRTSSELQVLTTLLLAMTANDALCAAA